MENRKRPFQCMIIAGGRENRRMRANALAAQLVCANQDQAPCGYCIHCRKAAKGIHPDIIPIERFFEKEDDAGKIIRVKAIRAMRADVSVEPNEAANKVYIIHDANLMNQEGQNALLKTIEEGPPYAAFLFLVDHPGELLETIRSRCALEQVQEDESEESLAPEVTEIFEALAEGSEERLNACLVRLELTVKPNARTVADWMLQLQLQLQRAAVESVTGRKNPLWSKLSVKKSTSELLQMAESAEKAQRMAESNVSAGHIFGWLCASLQKSSE